MFARMALAFVYTLAPLTLDGPPSGGDEPVAPAQSAEPGTTDATKPVTVEGATAAKSEPTEKHDASKPEIAVPFPHPMITEVLYAVRGGEAGDANADGKRHVSGDEFIELYNPHDRPIQLRGYKLTDSNPADKGQLRFMFPLLELPPRGVVVVFNGFQCSWFGPVGDEKAAAAATNERFGGAWVFTLKAATQYVAFSNSGDHVLLTAPDGTAVQRVSWGEPKDASAFAAVEPLVEDRAMQTGKSSVQRDGLSRVSGFRSHADLPFEFGGDRLFSPGVWRPLPEPKARKRVEENKDRLEGDEGGEAGVGK